MTTNIRNGDAMTLRTALSIALLLIWLPAAQAAVEARLDQNPVYAGDPVVLTITVKGNADGQPDLAPLEKDFRVLGTGSSTSVRIVNGVTSSTRSWTIRLAPLRQGDLTIPALRVGAEQTRPITLTVREMPPEVEAKLREHIRIEVSTGNDGAPVYVQQHIALPPYLYPAKQRRTLRPQNGQRYQSHGYSR